MSKFFRSMIFQGVVAHLLYFVVYFLGNYSYGVSHPGVILGYYFFSLAFVLFVLVPESRAIKSVSAQMEDIRDGNFKKVKPPRGSGEITELYNKVLDLGAYISRTQNNLENQRNQLDSILAYMDDGVIATDRRGNIIMANKSAQNYFNAEEGELIQKKILDVMDIADQFTFYDLLEKEPEITIETRTASDEFITLRVKFALFRRESGFISGVIAVLHDTTEQDKAERERRLFVSNVSHELRTPLTSVKAYLEALEDGAIEDKEVAESFLNVSLTETNRMIRMITDLLTLSRMDQDRVVLDKEVINLVDFLNYQLNRLDKILETDPTDFFTADFQIVRKFPDQAVWVEIDTDKITQVIDNIVNNAFKYSPNGGTITVSLEVHEKDVLVSITDEGMGIPKKDLPKVFDRFYRVDNASRNSKVGGTGLGLSIVHDIIKMHGGAISVTSPGKDQGTTFSFTLPYSADVEPDFSDDWDDVEEFDEIKS